MVRMQLRENSSEDDTTMRSSAAWDRSRQPRRSILKRRSPSKERTSRGARVETHLTVPSCDIQDLLHEMTLSERKPTPPRVVTVKASKLYGNPYQNCHHYDVSTSVTIRYGISDQRIRELRNHEALISFMDIYDIPSLLKELVSQNVDVFYEPGNNDFYCNAYWAVMFTDAIAELVFEKLGICLDSDISYDPTVDIRSCVKSMAEMTHILKDQLSVCDWLTTTIGPNYQNDNIPYQLGPHLQEELNKLLGVLTSSNDKWIEGAVSLLC